MKKNINSYITSLAIFTAIFATCINGYSQDKKQEFSISLGGPFSYVDSDSPGKTVPGIGVSAGLRYSYYVCENLSLGIGVEYQTYNSDLKYNLFAGSYAATDAENENFQFRYKGTNVREEQKLAYINVPINVQFETRGTSKLYVSAGAKIGFASSGSYQTTFQNLTTSGYYPQYNVELFSPAFAGFASTNNLKTNEQDLDTEVSYSATFETGLKQELGYRNSLYIGAYFEYGLNNIYDKTGNGNLVQYNSKLPVELGYNTLLNTTVSSNVRLVSYGLKLRFALR
ncbi:porin family protein [Flavobacterium defluvii]|uniref:Outer membrane protein beta-barrel domain-containing protein n=1 Tax=Flavobacterium defluvii TaxID=370979 RepID=A0A1M5UJT9_9FLAO|nr:outer membrane beta-barrel protein [Flavobacterium defluvii]SHH63239.1 Outer membrane protein beta-barrel domain-containing protein [Flavobacterium defluvii]